MKKIFTLCAAALVGMTSAVAGVQWKSNLSPIAKIDPAKVSTLVQDAQTRAANAQLLGGDNVIRRTAMINGVEWSAVITNVGDDFWMDYVAPGSEEFAQLWVGGYIELAVRNGNVENTRLRYIAFWPRQKVMLENPADPEAPLSIEDICTIGAPFQVLEKQSMGIMLNEQNQVQAFGIFNVNSTNIGADGQPAGGPWWSEYNFYPSTWKGVACAPAEGSIVQISEFEPETSYMAIHTEGTLLNAGGSNVAAYSLDYDGEGYADGFTPIVKEMKAAEMHVVNTGVWDTQAQSDNELYLYDIDWGPLQRYYIMLCGEGFTYPAGAFEGTSYPFDGPYRKEGATTPVNYLHGALYSEVGKEFNDNGIWTLKIFEIKSSGSFVETIQAPEAGDAVWAGYNGDVVPYCMYDGLTCVYNQYYSVLQEGTKLFSGTTEGFLVNGHDQYNDLVKVKFDGKIVYHYDPEDTSLTREIDAIGTASGVENVNAADAKAFDIYDINGRIVRRNAVSFDGLDKGIYISKGKKVVVK